VAVAAILQLAGLVDTKDVVPVTGNVQADYTDSDQVHLKWFEALAEAYSRPDSKVRASSHHRHLWSEVLVEAFFLPSGTDLSRSPSIWHISALPTK
jgi:hypothetical protein